MLSEITFACTYLDPANSITPVSTQTNKSVLATVGIQIVKLSRHTVTYVVKVWLKIRSKGYFQDCTTGIAIYFRQILFYDLSSYFMISVGWEAMNWVSLAAIQGQAWEWHLLFLHYLGHISVVCAVSTNPALLSSAVCYVPYVDELTLVPTAAP